MNEIRDLIKNATLTKTSQIIANFVLDNISDACFMTSTDIALALKISESSVIRFARALGFHGFIDFQKALRQGYSEEISSISNTVTVPAQRLAQSLQNQPAAGPLHAHCENIIRDVNSVLRRNSQKTFDEAVSILLASHRKFIISSRANASVGNYFFLLLRHMLPDVYSANHSSLSTIDLLCDITEQDCVIIFSFPRYSELDRQALEMASQRGAKVIAFTDRESSFSAQHAAVRILADVNSNVFFNSYVGVQFAMEALCASLSLRIGSINEGKLTAVDQYLEKLGLF